VLLLRSMRLCSALLLLAVAAPLAAQDASQPVDSRAKQIQAERLNKAATLTPDEPDRIETLFNKTMDRIPRLLRLGPVRFQTGGMYDAAGFAIGARLVWKSPEDQLRLGLSAVGTTRSFYAVRTGMAVLPGWANRQFSIGIDAAHSDAPKLEYYGSGPNSSKGGRTDYRREDTSVDLRLAWTRARSPFSAGFEAGPLFVNVGRGTDSRFASAETVYSPRQAPGIDVQTKFLRTETYADVDSRDYPGDPRDGSHVAVRHQHYGDMKVERYSFDRIFVGAEHYLPFLNKKRIIGLRANTELTHHSRGQVIPFYLQSTLGGPTDLRGFRRFRFSGDNAIRLNAEYRWEVSAGFDMALFADAGKVFDHARQISLRHLQTSPGFGLRFKSRDSVVMRIDTGFSREGFQTWVRFNTGL
jgi:outer membrane protein assembly factor BamA